MSSQAPTQRSDAGIQSDPTPSYPVNYKPNENYPNNQAQYPSNPPENQRVVFQVVKNPQSSNKPIPYTQDPYQEPFDKMLSKDKQTLFDEHKDPEILKLMESMGGPENFCTHYRISPAEFEKLFPHLAYKGQEPQQQVQQSEVANSGPIYYQPQPVSFNPAHPQAQVVQPQPQTQTQTYSPQPMPAMTQQPVQQVPPRNQPIQHVNVLPPPRKSQQAYANPSYSVAPKVISNSPYRPTPQQAQIYRPQPQIIARTVQQVQPQTQPVSYFTNPTTTNRVQLTHSPIQRTAGYTPQLKTFQSSPPRSFLPPQQVVRHTNTNYLSQTNHTRTPTTTYNTIVTHPQINPTPSYYTPSRTLVSPTAQTKTVISNGPAQNLNKVQINGAPPLQQVNNGPTTPKTKPRIITTNSVEKA